MPALISVVPPLLDAIISGARALPELSEANGWTVADGFTTSGTSRSILWIGVEDPFSSGQSQAAETTIERKTDIGRAESGWISCFVESWDGGKEAKTARDEAYSAISALVAFLRSDSITIAGTRLLVLDYETGQLAQDLTDDGALAVVSFRITLLARL